MKKQKIIDKKSLRDYIWWFRKGKEVGRKEAQAEFIKILDNADFGSYIIELKAGAMFDVDKFIKKEIKAKLQRKK